MAKSSAAMGRLVAALLVALALVAAPSQAQLSPDFYAKTCPNLPKVVGPIVLDAIKKEPRMAASLVRLHFHDCFVQGCDGGILLDDDSRLPLGEKTALPNINSVRGYEVIDKIKAEVEKACPRRVSCADITTLASTFSVAFAGGPLWFSPLGRRDSLTANFSAALEFLPGPSASVNELKEKFKNVGLLTRDLVALSGAHTLGLTRCVALVATGRLYNFNGTGAADPLIEAKLLEELKATCPINGDLNVTFPLDPTSNVFDNRYFKELLISRGVLGSDQVLFAGTQATDTKSIVNQYARNQTKFFEDFVKSMIKMGNMKPLTGSNGEVRVNCRKPNSLLLEDSQPLIELRSDM